MREVIFRGKRLDNGEWVEGFLLKGERTYIITSEAAYYKVVSTAYHCSVKLVEVIPETIGQWTGLADKNGVKVFEGDILHSDYGENYKVFYTTKSCSFMAECIQGNAPMLGNYRMGECWSNTIAVIGSIHDKAVEE